MGGCAAGVYENIEAQLVGWKYLVVSRRGELGEAKVVLQ